MPTTPKAIHDLLDDAASRRPQAPAICDRNGAWSYADLLQHGRSCARWLWERGVRNGDRVVARLPGCREAAALLYATSRVGAMFVPVSVKLRPFQLRGMLADADPALVLVQPHDADVVSQLTERPVLALPAAWRQVQTAAPEVPVAPPTSQDTALLFYTSGTTAAPKAVVCPHAQVVFAAKAIGSRLAYQPHDVVFSTLPIAFDYGLYQLLLSALATAELVLAPEAAGASLLVQLRSARATVVPLLPPLAAMLLALAARDRRPTAVRLFTNTGAALAPSTVAALRHQFPGAQVALMFGLTECKRVSILEPDGDLERPWSVGVPLPGTEVLIVDEAGEPLPSGQVGEIVVRGPHVMAGYWRAPTLTALRFRRCEPAAEVRLHTGDYGFLDEDGYLYFEGRRDDIFKAQGVRVSTLEIEAAACDIPGIRQAAALPPQNGRGAILCVAGAHRADQVLRELSVRLEHAKMPQACHVLETLPLGVNGKTDKAQLSRWFSGARP